MIKTVCLYICLEKKYKKSINKNPFPLVHNISQVEPKYKYSFSTTADLNAPEIDPLFEFQFINNEFDYQMMPDDDNQGSNTDEMNKFQDPEAESDEWKNLSIDCDFIEPLNIQMEETPINQIAIKEDLNDNLSLII